MNLKQSARHAPAGFGRAVFAVAAGVLASLAAGEPPQARAETYIELGRTVEACAGDVAVLSARGPWLPAPRGRWRSVDVATDGRGYWAWRCDGSENRARISHAGVERLRVRPGGGGVEFVAFGRGAIDEPVSEAPVDEPANGSDEMIGERRGDICRGALSVKNGYGRAQPIPRGRWIYLRVAARDDGYWTWSCDERTDYSRVGLTPPDYLQVFQSAHSGRVIWRAFRW